MIEEVSGTLRLITVEIYTGFPELSGGWKPVDHIIATPMDLTLFFEGFCPACRNKFIQCKLEDCNVAMFPWCEKCGWHWRGEIKEMHIKDATLFMGLPQK
jgi:hypothetical protein